MINRPYPIPFEIRTFELADPLRSMNINIVTVDDSVTYYRPIIDNLATLH